MSIFCPTCNFEFEGTGFVTGDVEKVKRIFDGNQDDLQDALKHEDTPPEESFLICMRCTSVLQQRDGKWVKVEPNEVEEGARQEIGDILMKILIRKFMNRFTENPEGGLVQAWMDMIAEVNRFRGDSAPKLVDKLHYELEKKLREEAN
jgi:hypothetical protein